MEDLEEVASLLFNKNNVALTGAGISQESGIPTFRGKDGLWDKYRPEELATREAFLKNPELFWEFYNFRRNLIKNAKPNEAHLILTKLENDRNLSCIISQNVDGLHNKAGSKNVIEIHGNIWNVKCETCGKVELRTETEGIIMCSSCNKITRPDVVLFGEAVRKIDEAFSIVRNADNLLVIGTSSVVYPAALLPYEGKKHSAKVIEINIAPTDLTNDADYFINGKAAEILPKIYNFMKRI